MKILTVAILFLITGYAQAGGWRALGDIEHLGKIGETVRIFNHTANVLGIKPHSSANAARINRTVGSAKNTSYNIKSKNVPYLLQDVNNTATLFRSIH